MSVRQTTHKVVGMAVANWCKSSRLECKNRMSVVGVCHWKSASQYNKGEFILVMNLEWLQQTEKCREKQLECEHLIFFCINT